MPTISSSDRCLFIGKTGSGKSYLAKQVMHSGNFKRIIVYDPKIEHDDLTSYFLVTNVKDFYYALKVGKAKIRCGFHDMKPEDFNFVCKAAYSLGNTLVVADEVPFMRGKLLDFHEKLIRMGRKRNCGIWHCIQRPAWVNSYILSESEHYFVFQLQLESDRKKIEGVIGEPATQANELRDHECIYYNARSGEVQKIRG